MKFSSGRVEKLAPPRKGWRAVLSYKDADGVWRKKKKSLDARTKTQAEHQMRQWWAEMEEEDGAVDASSSAPTLAELVTAHVDKAESVGSISYSTAEGYRGALRTVPESLASTPVDTITSDALADLEGNLMNQGYSSSTVGKVHRLLKMCLNEAVNDGIIVRNPLNRVKPPKRVPTKKGINALSADERERLKRQLDTPNPSPVMMAATIALYTGMRRGEICGLRWGDIDFDHGVLWVRRSIGETNGKCSVQPTKTGRDRDIAMPAKLTKALSMWLAAGIGGDVYVIGEGDSFMRPGYITREWITLARFLNLRGTEGRLCTFHDLRHTWATAAVAAGVDIKTVSSNLGHANAAMTLNIYASADPEAKRRAADTMDSVI